MSTVVCANRDCRVADTGRCIEGIPVLTDCPHYGKEPAPLPPPVPDQPFQLKPEAVDLPRAQTLTVTEANTLIRQRPSRLVAIVGPHDAGKTSLISGLYDLFQSGKVGECMFGGSLTIQSFERACHGSRRASNRTEPFTDRTERGEVRFYHLNVVPGANQSAAALLLGDRAGEEYFETRNEIDAAATFPELMHADTLTILVDGEKLINSVTRHDLRADVQLTLQAFLEGGIPSTLQRLALVLTKVDAVRRSGTADRALADFQGLTTLIESKFGSNFAEVESFAVAASPKFDVARRGEGLPELLAYWLRVPRRQTPARLKYQVFKLEARQFARLTPKHQEPV